MATTLYGIPNCDTVKKARKWLDEHKIEYRFHDFRKDGLNDKQLAAWLTQLDWETLLNKRSTTWKQLSDADKTGLNESKALKLLLANPTLIKRPVLESKKQVEVGFKADTYQSLFN